MLRENQVATRATFQFYRQTSRPFPTQREQAPIPTVRWRLIAGNRRELGRSAELFADVTAGETHVEELVAGLEMLSVRVLIEPVAARWTWEVHLDGRSLASSSRSYARRIECLLSVQQFLRLVPQARVDPTLRVFSVDRRGRR
ncbi:MAG: hypothetical protein ACLGIV_14805 [Actinomycetes bacterium]